MGAGRIAFLGTPGVVRDADRFSLDELLDVLGANSGNLIFQHAAQLLIGGRHLHIGRSETAYTDIAALRDCSTLVFPAANHLRANADWTGLNTYLERCGLPLVVLGLGAQMSADAGREARLAILQNPHVRRLVDILRDRGQLITVRGAQSAEICQELGLDVIPLGCPSALINPNPDLGKSIARQLAIIAAQGIEQSFALTAAAPFEIRPDERLMAVERKLLDWLGKYSGLYVQQSGGAVSLRMANGQWFDLAPTARRSFETILWSGDPVEFWALMARAGRVFTSAPDWIDAMANLGFSMGSRLHGNMAAIAAGRPGVLISHDGRTGELAKLMHLPRLEMDDLAKAKTPTDAISKVRFDGAAFDNWRQQTAQELAKHLARIGLPASVHLQALAAGYSQEDAA